MTACHHFRVSFYQPGLNIDPIDRLKPYYPQQQECFSPDSPNGHNVSFTPMGHSSLRTGHGHILHARWHIECNMNRVWKYLTWNKVWGLHMLRVRTHSRWRTLKNIVKIFLPSRVTARRKSGIIWHNNQSHPFCNLWQSVNSKWWEPVTWWVDKRVSSTVDTPSLCRWYSDG